MTATPAQTASRQIPDLPRAIETNRLTKYYGKARGIIDVDLDITQGDIFGFIGPNGAGKSTLIRTLLGLIAPTGGRASVLGMDCSKQKDKILASVGYMPSEVQFYHGMKVHELIRFSARLRKKDCSDQAAMLCARLGLDESRKIDELSLGNRKKVGIVCALQHDPSLFILDEPTSGLDPLIQKEFFSLLMERHARGATIMLSSHVLSEVQRYCRNAAIIREGRIIASGTVDSLTTTARRVRLRGTAIVPLSDGVRDVIQQADGVDFLYQGDMGALIHALDALEFTDVTIEEPDIEEVFMHYYENGGSSC